MTPPFRNRLKTPEEVELERKQRELKRYQVELGDWERMFSDLKAEIRTFEQLYEDTVGGRITALEELEWQLNGILGTEKTPHRQEPLSDEQAFSHFHHTTDLLDDEDESATRHLLHEHQVALPWGCQGGASRPGLGRGGPSAAPGTDGLCQPGLRIGRPQIP